MEVEEIGKNNCIIMLLKIGKGRKGAKIIIFNFQVVQSVVNPVAKVSKSYDSKNH